MEKQLLELANEVQPVSYSFAITYYRKKMGLTQNQLAERLDVSLTTIKWWETNRRNPNPASLQKLAEAFNVELELLTEDAYTVETAKQIVAEQVALIHSKPMDQVSNSERTWLLNVVKTLTPNVIIEKEIVSREDGEGKTTLQVAIKKTEQLRDKS